MTVSVYLADGHDTSPFTASLVVESQLPAATFSHGPSADAPPAFGLQECNRCLGDSVGRYAEVVVSRSLERPRRGGHRGSSVALETGAVEVSRPSTERCEFHHRGAKVTGLLSDSDDDSVPVPKHDLCFSTRSGPRAVKSRLAGRLYVTVVESSEADAV